MQDDTSPLRQLLVAAFSDEDFTAFCSDHFPEIYEQFTVGQTKGQRIQLLMDAARRRNRLPELLERVREANPHKYAEFEPLVSGTVLISPLAIPSGTLPTPRHPVVGRERELEQVLAALRQRRTVLLYGMGGIGKTTLAAEAAARLREESTFAGGVAWIRDVGAASLDSVCDAIARELGNEDIPKLTGHPKAEATRALLASQDILLVLDDVAGPPTAHAFIDTCLPPGNALLVTSRGRILVPDVHEPIQVSALTRDAAIALFRERAGLTAETDDQLVGTICDLLENHPLALTVAAGRTRAEDMPLSRLCMRLADEKSRLQSLRLGEDEDKNRNVWASLNLSYADLTERQRQIFIYLVACFGETTGLELLADVAGMSQLDCEDIIGQLVVWSLVERRGDRLRLHRLVRDFGREISSADLETTRHQVLRAAIAYANRYDQPTLERHSKLEAELDNLRAAVRYAVEHGAWQDAIDLATHLLNPVLGARGYWRELVDVGRLGILAAESSEDQEALARLAMNTAGLLLEDHAEARRLYEWRLAVKRHLGDQLGIAHGLHNLGVIAREQGEEIEARGLLRQGLKIRQALGDRAGIAASLLELGRLAQAQGDSRRAQRLYKRSHGIFESLGDLRGSADTLHQLGAVAYQQGQHAEASRRYQESLAIEQELGDKRGIAINLNGLGIIMEERGDLAAAWRLYVDSLVIKHALQDQRGIATSLHNLGNVAIQRGDHEQAHRLYEQSLAINRQLGDPAGTANCLYGLASVAWQRGNKTEARQLLEEALAHFEQLQSPHAEMVRGQLSQFDRNDDPSDTCPSDDT